MTARRRGSNFLLAWRERAGDLPDVPATDEELEALAVEVARSRDTSNALTARLAVELVSRGATFRRAANLLQVSPAAVHTWVKEAKDDY